MALSLVPGLFSTVALILTLSTSMATATGGEGVAADVRRWNTEEEVAGGLADYVANLSRKYVDDTNKFTVAVAGGFLPYALRKLTEKPYLHSVDWSKWQVFWVDDRFVPPTDRENNYKLAYDDFLFKVPIPAGNIHAVDTKLKSVDAAADDYEARLKAFVKNKTLDSSGPNGFPKIDLILMGIGPDGHVASLFPGHPLLQEKQRWAAAVKDAPYEPRQRVTLTLPVLNAAANFGFVITATGYPAWIKEALAENVQRAVHGGGSVVAGGGRGQINLLPVQLVSPQGHLIWFLDTPTASKL